MSEIIDSPSQLSGLSELEYQRQRRNMAKTAGVTVGFLDKQFKATRVQNQQGPGSALSFEDILPTEEPVHPGRILDDMVASVRRFVSLPDGGAEIAACWALFAWTHDAFQVSPILNIGSPQKGSGKTTLLDWIQRVVPRPLPTSHATTAAIFRAIEKWRPSLLLDEADSFMRESEELRGLLNSGHVRTTARVLRTVDTPEGPEVRAFSSWAPKCLAGIGKLPETLADRSITIMLQRKRSSESVERLRIGREEDHFRGIRQRCSNFADQYFGRLGNHDPEIPKELSNRNADNWAVLFAVGDMAGGDWPNQIRAVSEKVVAGDDSDARTQLLGDIKSAFDEVGAYALATKSIIEHLVELDEAPWSSWARGGKPITARHLGSMLGPYGVSSSKLRIDGLQVKGYRRTDFAEPWDRYLPSDPKNCRTSVPSDDTSLQINDLRGTRPSTGTDKMGTRDTDGTRRKSTSTGQSTGNISSISISENDIITERYLGTDKTGWSGEEVSLPDESEPELEIF